MLTVKHINIRGDERLFEVMDVKLVRGTDYTKCHGSGGTHSEHDYVEIDIGEERLQGTISGGTVYVMNRHGQTVARYDLGASPVPLDKIGAEIELAVRNTTLAA